MVGDGKESAEIVAELHPQLSIEFQDRVHEVIQEMRLAALMWGAGPTDFQSIPNRLFAIGEGRQDGQG